MLKKLLSIILAGCLCFACAACTNVPQKVNPVERSLPDYDLKEDELSIDIGGWVAPVNFDQTQVEYLKEAGVNVLQLARSGADTYNFQFSQVLSEKDANLLRLCEQNDIKVYPHIAGKVAERLVDVKNVANYAACKGLIFDEPNKRQIDEIAAKLRTFCNTANGKDLIVNLYPSFGPTVKTDFNGSYREYIDYFCSNVLENITSGQKWLSADRYVLTYDGKQPCLDTGWLSDVEAIAQKAREYDDVKTNFFIQTMPYGGESTSGTIEGSRDRTPTYEDVRLQEYALLSFGYDMISLFCYGTPSVVPNGEFLERQKAMIDRDGTKTPIFDAVKKANQEILAFDHVILQFDWQGVFTCDAGKKSTAKERTSNPSFKCLAQRMSIEEVACLSSVETTADTLFGYFIDEDDNAGFTAVNYNDSTLELSDEVTFEFDSSYNFSKALCYIGGEKHTLDIKNNRLTLDLGVGEGVFVIPY